MLCPNNQIWVEKCREELINIEMKNLRTRAMYWTNIVNTKTIEYHQKLSINIIKNFNRFLYEIENPLHHLVYLTNWKGLKTDKLLNIPTEYTSFNLKAKNWVCGRRAPNYAQTLFPEMISSAERYAHNLSVHLFGSSTKIGQLYQIGFMCFVLSELCSARITLNDRSKKTHLLFENSIKTNNRTVQSLQKYIFDPQTTSIHSTKLSTLSMYFQSKFQKICASIKAQIYQLDEEKKQQNTEDINMNINIHQAIHTLISLQQQQQTTMQTLSDRVSTLENMLKTVEPELPSADKHCNESQPVQQTSNNMMRSMQPIQHSSENAVNHGVKIIITDPSSAAEYLRQLKTLQR